MEKARSRARGKFKGFLSCITIPQPLGETNKVEHDFKNAHESGPPLTPKPKGHILEDPARLELVKAEEARRKRKCDETLLALEKIQERIDYTITEYEGLEGSRAEGSEIDPNVDLEVVEDPNKLFELLADPKLRSRYHQKLVVFVIDYEEKQVELEKVLGQLQDFFVETQAGGTSDLLKEVAEEELDLDEATRVLGGALSTAQNAVQKLVGIKKEMDHLMSIVAAYPDTSKGRKKMEKALLKAQEEVATFSKNLEELQANLKQSTEKSSQLQVQLDVKTKECTKLHKTADEVKLLQVGNDKLKRELGAAENALKESQEELSAMKSQQPTALLTESQVDKQKELEAELDEEKKKYGNLAAEMKLLVKTQMDDIEAMKAEHEAESNEIRGRFEDQLKSLMGEDAYEFGEGDLANSTAESADIRADNTDFEEASHGAISPETQSQVDDTTATTKGEQEQAADEENLVSTPRSNTPAQAGSLTASRTSLPPRGSKHDITIDQQQIEEMRREHEANAQNQVDEIKAKSHQMIALLQSQLADAKQQVAEKERLEAELGGTNKQLLETKLLCDELNKKLREENSALLETLQQREEELKSTVETQLLPVTSVTFSPAQSPMHSVSTVPLVAMDEVMDDSQILIAGDSAMDERSNVSLEKSFVSMDPAPLGSPLQQSGLISGEGSFVGMRPSSNFRHQSSPPHYSLSMLAVSRLSHHSSQNTAVNYSHPVVVEWGKAYDSIIKFKEGLIAMLSEHQDRMPQFPSFVEELKNIELHSLDKKQDVQGQITEMRFSLALFLHQIEQTLQESFSQMLAEMDEKDQAGAVARDSEPPESFRTEMEKAVTHLTEQMRQRENNHKAEVERKKDTIAQLSSKVENLKVEVAKLRRSQGSNKEGIIMFTRLDSERNTKALETALEKERISPATFNQLSSTMEDYLIIPGQRLAGLSQRWQEKTAATKLVQHVQRSCLDPVQVSSIVQGIVGIEEKRQMKFTSKMNRLRDARKQLAHSLTDNLSYVEEQTSMFLIKPLFGNRFSESHELITPISRPLPVVPRYSSAAAGSRAYNGTNTSMSFRTPSAPASNVRLIQSYLQSQRQQVDPQQLIRSINTADSLRKSNCGSPLPRVKSSKQSRNSIFAQHLSPATREAASPPAATMATEPGQGVWNVRTSDVSTEKQEPTAGHLHVQQPSFSKLLELDIARHRQAENLLGHLLPNYHQRSTSVGIGTSRHCTPSPHVQKLISLPEEASPASSSSNHSQAKKSWGRALPPVEVPSRTDTLVVM